MRKITIYALLIILVLFSGLAFAAETPKELKLVKKYHFDSPITSAAFYPDGKPKIVCTENKIIFYDSNEKVQRERKLDADQMARVSENGECIAIVRSHGIGTEHFVYTDKKGKVLFERDCGAEGYSISPNGEYIIFQSYANLSKFGFIKIYTKSGELLGIYDPNIKQQADQFIVHFTPDSKYWLVAIQFRDGRNYKIALAKFIGDSAVPVFRKSLDAELNEAGISDNGKAIVVGGFIWGGNSRISATPIFYFNENGQSWVNDNSGPIVNISSDGEQVRSYPLYFRHNPGSEDAISVIDSSGEGISNISLKEYFSSADKINLTALNQFNSNSNIYIFVSIGIVDVGDTVMLFNASTKNMEKDLIPIVSGKSELGYMQSSQISNRNIVAHGNTIEIIGKTQIRMYELK